MRAFAEAGHCFAKLASGHATGKIAITIPSAWGERGRWRGRWQRQGRRCGRQVTALSAGSSDATATAGGAAAAAMMPMRKVHFGAARKWEESKNRRCLLTATQTLQEGILPWVPWRNVHLAEPRTEVGMTEQEAGRPGMKRRGTRSRRSKDDTE
ncbi:unnamed protein product, partial [Phaeothamnion confervicola]